MASGVFRELGVRLESGSAAEQAVASCAHCDEPRDLRDRIWIKFTDHNAFGVMEATTSTPRRGTLIHVPMPAQLCERG